MGVHEGLLLRGLPFWRGAGLADAVGGGGWLGEAVDEERSGTGLKAATCSIVQLTAKASIWVRLHDISANVRIGIGSEFDAAAVEWLTSASVLKRNTPPPPLQATAYTIFRPKFCILRMLLWFGRIIPVAGSKEESDVIE